MNTVFNKLLNEINVQAGVDFKTACVNLEAYIFAFERTEIISCITNIGVIPEYIMHDSTEEKLFAKAADIMLAKTFQLLGMNAVVNKERADSADVTVRSRYHNYSLVADAKAFRLSRTAKNQKDFKVASLSEWKQDADFAVLVCPYYQYPRQSSQIYSQALDKNVCLFSWEHLYAMLAAGVEETDKSSLSGIWSVSDSISEKISVKDNKSNFFDYSNSFIAKYLGINGALQFYISDSLKSIVKRGFDEITFWDEREREIKNYSREQAINELLILSKIKEKKTTIQKYIDFLKAQVV